MFKSLIGLALAYMQELFSEQGTDCELHDSFLKLTSSQPRTNYLKRNSCHNGDFLTRKYQIENQINWASQEDRFRTEIIGLSLEKKRMLQPLRLLLICQIFKAK